MQRVNLRTICCEVRDTPQRREVGEGGGGREVGERTGGREVWGEERGRERMLEEGNSCGERREGGKGEEGRVEKGIPTWMLAYIPTWSYLIKLLNVLEVT